MPGRVKYRGSAAARPRCAARTGRWSMISQAPIFTIHAELADIRHFGTTPYGERRVVDILGGRVEGPRLQGRILPGADWQIARRTGSPILRRATRSRPIAARASSYAATG